MTDFTIQNAKDARANSSVPLLVGLSGPSGSGKTYTALRLASGMQKVYGGKVFMIDTESRRSLHYADKFDFEFVEFQAPYSSMRFLEALKFAKENGAGVTIVDSCTHEHTGTGGHNDLWEQEIDRMAGNDAAKRERVKMLAIQKPKAMRRKLIDYIVTTQDMPVIFCFRAKESAKPMKVTANGRQKTEVVSTGFTMIGAEEWLFECALSAMFKPGCNGVPDWRPDLIGEKAATKLPEQFKWLAEREGPMDEEVGAALAKWAKGGREEAESDYAKVARFKATILGRINDAPAKADVQKVLDGNAAGLSKLKESEPEVYREVMDAAEAAMRERPERASEDLLPAG